MKRLGTEQEYNIPYRMLGFIFPFLLLPTLYSITNGLQLAASNVSASKLVTLPSASNAMFSSYVSISFGTLEIDKFDPYFELLRLDTTYLAISAVSMAIAVILWCRRFAGYGFRHYEVVVRAALLSFLISLSGFLMLRATPSNSWDETFLFASQVDSILGGHGNRVHITGAQAYAESSTDVGFIWISAFVKVVAQISTLHALLLTNAIGFALLWLFSVQLGRSEGNSRSLLPFGILILMITSPQPIAASAAGFPVSWSALALFLIFGECLDSGKPPSLRRHFLVVVFAVFVRPEYILPCVVMSSGILFRNYRRSEHIVLLGGKRARPFGSSINISYPYLVVALYFFSKKICYGQAFPTALRGKSVGFAGDYLYAGIGYFERTISEGGMGGLIGATVLLAVLARKRSLLAVVCGITVLIPGILVGGDMFPTYWARYMWPIVTALFLAFLVKPSVSPQKQGALSRRDTNHKIAYGLVCSVVVMNLSVSADKLPWRNLRQSATHGRETRDYDGEPQNLDEWTIRPVCLARAGELLRAVLPKNVGIATTELNTLAYFARQPLTDLFGLVDSRTASQVHEPLQAGSWGYRRRNPALVLLDRPGVLYESSGLACRVGASNYGDERASVIDALRDGDFGPASDELRQVVASESFQYRFGTPEVISEKYAPVNFYTSAGLSVLVFIRLDLVRKVIDSSQNAGAKATVLEL